MPKWYPCLVHVYINKGVELLYGNSRTLQNCTPPCFLKASYKPFLMKLSYLITERRRRKVLLSNLCMLLIAKRFDFEFNMWSLRQQCSTTNVDLGSFLSKINPALKKHCCWKDRTGQEREWDNAIPVTSSLLFHHYKWQEMKQEAHFPSWKPSRLHLRCCWKKDLDIWTLVTNESSALLECPGVL